MKLSFTDEEWSKIARALESQGAVLDDNLRVEMALNIGASLHYQRTSLWVDDWNYDAARKEVANLAQMRDSPYRRGNASLQIALEDEIDRIKKLDQSARALKGKTNTSDRDKILKVCFETWQHLFGKTPNRNSTGGPFYKFALATAKPFIGRFEPGVVRDFIANNDKL